MAAMFPNLLVLLLSFLLTCLGSAQEESGRFTFNRFGSDNSTLSLQGSAKFSPDGLLVLNSGEVQTMGSAFFPSPITFKNSTNGTASSFSTIFVFSISSKYRTSSGQGMAFVVTPGKDLSGFFPSLYLGIFNVTNIDNVANHVFEAKLYTILSVEFEDINDNHVGIDTAGYYTPRGFTSLSLISGKYMQVWVDYDGNKKQLDVTLAPINRKKPKAPLLSHSIDLSLVMKEAMYVGFSASTSMVPSWHYLLGWSFSMNGQAQELTVSNLPAVESKERYVLLRFVVPIISVCFLTVSAYGVFYFLRKRVFAEVLEDWELDYGPHRFKYKDLYVATKGFREHDLLGAGGFGRVYRGVLATSKIDIAVKRVSHESRQGIKEFVAEIITIGRLRHRNVVTLLGYCRRKNELLLVYEYMPNGSLNKYLHNQPKLTLNWSQRFRVIKGVASGLVYLHEGWEKVVIHRDIKASNILLDADMNARLGDFGLARLYNHEDEPQSTNIAGTLGYLAPEHVRTSKATKATDIYAFGAFILEVACGRKPIEVRENEDAILVDWVFSHWRRGEILETRDPNLGEEFVSTEVELVLMLGLVCSHSDPGARPSILQVARYFQGEIPMQQLSSTLSLCASGLTFSNGGGFEDRPFDELSAVQVSSCVEESFLSSGR